MTSAEDRIPKRLSFAGAILFLFANMTGAFAGMAATGQVAADPHIALGAHVAALLGALWLLGGAFTLKYVALGERGRSALAWLWIVPAYANWIISTGKSFPNVHGLELAGNGANKAVFVLLVIFVVTPTFAGGLLWIWSLRPQRSA